jgi:hypothetical protein
MDLVGPPPATKQKFNPFSDDDVGSGGDMEHTTD